MKMTLSPPPRGHFSFSTRPGRGKMEAVVVFARFEDELKQNLGQKTRFKSPENLHCDDVGALTIVFCFVFRFC